MSHGNNIIVAPDSIYDVQQTIGSGLAGLGNLIHSGKINQWSKYKPVGLAKLFTLDELASDKVTWLTTATWWKGNGKTIDVPAGTVIGSYTMQDPGRWFIKCGIKILGFSSTRDVLGAFNPAGNPCTEQNIENSLLKDNYTYLPPEGGTAEPFRLTDFNQYKHDANFVIIPGYETSLGVERILLRRSSVDPVYSECELWTYTTLDGQATELDIDDLFDSTLFRVVTGVLDGNNLTAVPIEWQQGTHDTDQYRQIRLNFNSINASTYYGKTIIGIYCIVVDNYYIPVLQANYYHPNTTIRYRQEGLRCYRAWKIEETTDPLPGEMSVSQKQNYGTSTAFLNIATNRSWHFMTEGRMDLWYLKIEMPMESAPYTITTNGIRIEFTGQFIDLNNRQQYATYIVEQTATVKFVLKNQEPDARDWGSSDTIQIAQGTGMQTMYLAIYDLFAKMKEQYTQGTIWRIRVIHGNYTTSGSFEPIHEASYGAPSGGTDALSVTF
jgi:hypothetical protein